MPTVLPSLRIFVVENDADTLKYFLMYLEELGHTVFHARTVAEALDRLPGTNCDVLISDIGLEDGTGWDLLHRLRDEGEELPRYAIAVSGLGRDSDRRKSEAAGYRHHLLKPYDLDALDRMLEEAAEETTAK